MRVHGTFALLILILFIQNKIISSESRAEFYRTHKGADGLMDRYEGSEDNEDEGILFLIN